MPQASSKRCDAAAVAPASGLHRNPILTAQAPSGTV